MRTKLLLAVLPIGFAAASLTGCGNNANSQVSTDVERLADKLAITQKSGLLLDDKDRYYTADQAEGDWVIPADPSTAAARQDELNALAVEIETTFADASATDAQKAVLARMLGDIRLSDAQYLSATAQNSYGHARSLAVDLQPYADKINAIQGLITILKGDRELIIDTLQTGDTGGVVEIDGIDQLEARAQAIQGRLNEAQAAYEEYEAKAEELSDTVQEFEGRELELKTAARTQTGDAQFDSLDEAVEAWLKARLAEIESEYNVLLGSAERQNADLNAADLVQVQSVIEQLEQGIASVREDIASLRTRVQGAQSERNDAADALSDAYNTVDARMEALVFNRLTKAGEQAGQAATYFGGIVTSGQAQSAMKREQLNAMMTQLNLMQQHAVSLSGYKSAVDTLAANGDEVLGADLANTLQGRSADLQSRIEAIQAAAEPLLVAAQDLSGTLLNASSSDTAQAQTLSQQNEYLQNVEATLDALPY